METKKTVRIKWVCRECGQVCSRPANLGRPAPGMCVKYDSAGKKAPHKWVKF